MGLWPRLGGCGPQGSQRSQGPRVKGSRGPRVRGPPISEAPRNRIRLGRSLGRPVRRSITPSIARPITRSIARCTRPFDPGVGTLTPKPKASEGGEKGKHLMGATRGGTPEGKETSACLVSYLSRCTRPFDPGVGTPTPKPEASEGGGKWKHFFIKTVFRARVSETGCPALKLFSLLVRLIARAVEGVPGPEWSRGPQGQGRGGDARWTVQSGLVSHLLCLYDCPSLITPSSQLLCL